MKFSYNWLQDYFKERLPKPEVLAKELGLKSFELEGIEKKGGDFLIDWDVLPNRSSDSLCYMGIVKEISAIFNVPHLNILHRAENVKFSKKFKTSDFVNLKVEDNKKVKRAVKNLAINIKVAPSPKRLKERLESIGQKSINNVVDITNFVMWTTGQPVHAFDFDKLSGGEKKNIFIKYAKKGEKITDLSGDEHVLNEKILVISDDKKSLDIAGVKGGENSRVSEKTTRVLMSACSFDYEQIRDTSRKLKIQTDASKRFENNVPSEKIDLAIKQFGYLLQEVCGAEVSSDVIDTNPNKIPNYKVGVSLSEINSLLGTFLEKEDVEKIFKRFNFSYKYLKPKSEIEKIISSNKILKKPYFFGASVLKDAPEKFDCSSLSSWIYKEAGISIPRVSVDQFVFFEKANEEELEKGDLVFSVNKKDKNVYYKTFEFLPGTKISSGVSHVGIYAGGGKNLHTSGKSKKTIIANLKKQTEFGNIVGYGKSPVSLTEKRFVVDIPYDRPDLRIKEDLVEEIGRVFGYENLEEKKFKEGFNLPDKNLLRENSEKVKDFLVYSGFFEISSRSIVGDGKVELLNSLNSQATKMRENLIDLLKEKVEKNFKHSDDPKFFEIGKIFTGIEKTKVLEHFSFAGIIGKRKIKEKNKEEIFLQTKGFLEKIFEILEIEKIEWKKTEKKDFVAEIFIKKESIGFVGINFWEINFEKIVENIEEKISYEKPSKYPKIERDVAFFTPEEFSYSEALEIIKNTKIKNLESLELFDIYKDIENKRKSFAFKLIFQSKKETLSDEFANRQMEELYKNLKKNNLEVR